MTRVLRTALRVPTVTIAEMLAAAAASGQTTAVPGFVQPDDDLTIIRKLLQSPDPRAQAWGAWYAGRDHLRQFIPLVQSVVAERASVASLEETAAAEVALDALIQIRASLPSQQLAVVHERRPAQALILASTANLEDEDVDSFLFAALATNDYNQWFAAANILLDRRTVGVASAIIRTIRLTVHVYVTRGDQGGGIGVGSGSGRGVGCGLGGRSGRNLPPVAEYRLGTVAIPGYVVLSTGPKTVYYQRIVTSGGSRGCVVVQRDGPTADDRLRYLAHLAKLNEDALPIRGRDSREVSLPPGAAVDGALEHIRQEILTRWSVLAQALVHMSVLSAEAAASDLPTIELIVHDQQ